MSFAHEVGVADFKWKSAAGRDYRTADTKRAFFLSLPPGGKLHRHRDVGDVESYHVVVQTNDRAMNYWTDSAGEHAIHMEQGKIYRVDRTLEHWAINDGDTDRIHLIVEW